MTYPFTALATGASMGKSTSGNRTFDVNTDGLAHVGLYPDFIADLQVLGMARQDLDPLLHSAEGYVAMWEKAHGKRGHLRGESVEGRPGYEPPSAGLARR